MIQTTDLYLGAFLILCGFALSLLNLRRVVKKNNEFSTVLLSENILLMCIGIAFVARSVYSVNTGNVETYDMERTAFTMDDDTSHCGFTSLLMSYGPLVVSLVNSFLSLIIDNYMHYKMLGNINEKVNENVVQDFQQVSSTRENNFSKLYEFMKKYFSYGTIAVQWVVPIIIALLMYPMDVKIISMDQARSFHDSCMAVLDVSNKMCENTTDLYEQTNYTSELRKYIPNITNYLDVYDNNQINSNTSEINSVLSNVLKVITNFNNHSEFMYTNMTKSARRPKMEERCTMICFTENKNLLIYMFVLAFISYFVPITISTIILTKIHLMEVNKTNMKTYVSRELLYNILFWTPVMFDTFLSLIACSYSMHGMRTSLFNIIANIYQAVKNFMNTKYFKENSVIPV